MEMARTITTPVTEDELRTYAEEKLRRRITDRAWDRFVSEGGVAEVLEHGADLDEFVERIGDFTSVEAESRRPSGRVERDAPGSWVAAREYAVSRVIARRLREEPGVVEIRNDLVGPAGLVAPDRLDDWVHARYYEDTPPNWHLPCLRCNQPPIASATTTERPAYGAGEKPEGARDRQWFPNTAAASKRAVAAAQRGAWVGMYDPRPLWRPGLAPNVEHQYREWPKPVPFSFWMLKGEDWWLPKDLVPPHGQLARLSALCADLAHKYQIDEAHVATFVVTGAPPHYSAAWATVTGPGINSIEVDRAIPIPSHRSYRSRINLSIDPALTADEVARFYAGLLRDYFPTGQRHARPAARSMRAAGDVIESHDGEPSAEAWRSWNRRNPDEAWKAPNGRVPFRRQVLVALRHLR